MGAIALGTVVFLVWMMFPASAHEAPAGWEYDVVCCSGRDCRPTEAGEIKESKEGFTYVRTGQLIPHGDRRIRQSKDEHFHVCTIGGNPDGRVLCIYEPMRAF